jgi:hypothetical protein
MVEVRRGTRVHLIPWDGGSTMLHWSMQIFRAHHGIYIPLISSQVSQAFSKCFDLKVKAVHGKFVRKLRRPVSF